MGKRIKTIVADEHHNLCHMLGIDYPSSNNAPFCRIIFCRKCNFVAITSLTSWMEAGD